MPTYVDAVFTRNHLDQGDPVVNVLSAAQYGERRLPGSINVPLEEPDFERRIQEAVPGKDRPVIVHCSSMECQASTKAARRMEALGYREVHDFKAGLEGWEQAGLPFESGEPARAASRPPRPGRERSSRREEPRGQEVPRP
jgi:rhodanese-related sulfurtransferase